MSLQAAAERALELEREGGASASYHRLSSIFSAAAQALDATDSRLEFLRWEAGLYRYQLRPATRDARSSLMRSPDLVAEDPGEDFTERGGLARPVAQLLDGDPEVHAVDAGPRGVVPSSARARDHPAGAAGCGESDASTLR